MDLNGRVAVIRISDNRQYSGNMIGYQDNFNPFSIRDNYGPGKFLVIEENPILYPLNRRIQKSELKSLKDDGGAEVVVMPGIDHVSIY